MKKNFKNHGKLDCAELDNVVGGENIFSTMFNIMKKTLTDPKRNPGGSGHSLWDDIKNFFNRPLWVTH